MKQRCCNPNCNSYHVYGGRGINICDAWINSFESFAQWALNNGYDTSLSIDRIDNDGNYCPENCRWATRKEQDHNRSNVVLYIHNGEEYTMNELAGFYEVDPNSIRRNLKKGMTIDESISEALRKRRKPWNLERYKRLYNARKKRSIERKKAASNC